ncbi:phage major capsid protein [Clostridium sp.]|uniref:phage major capsid protein n=1 Tax=Clostridium sp. TaxID=1506 RepID=UPI003FD8BA75
MEKTINDLMIEFNDLLANSLEFKNEKEMKEAANKLKKMKNEMRNLDNRVDFDDDGYAGITNSHEMGREGGVNLSVGNVATKGNIQFLNSANLEKVYTNKDNLDLGKYVKGALTGNWENASNEMGQFKALSTSTGTVLIPTSLSATVLAAVMNRSLIYKSGVPTVDMPNGNLTIAKVTKNPTFGFKEELATVEPQDATFEGVQLKGKMIYGLVKVSLEVLHSAANLSEILLQAMSDSIASSIDTAMLYGSDVNGIKGIFGTEGINSVEAAAVNYIPFVNAVGKIRQANGEPTILGINATTDTALNLLADTTGQPLNAPKVIDSLNRIVSNNLRNNLGTGLDEGEAMVYDPNSLIIGNQVKFMFETSREKGFDDGSVWLRVYSLLDMAVVRPTGITHITKLK